MKFKVGDKVIINGGLYVSSNANAPVSFVKNKVTTITRVAPGAKHPYNTTGDLGWMNESDIRLYEEEDKTYECEIELIDKGNLIPYLKEHQDKVIIINSDDLKKVLGL